MSFRNHFREAMAAPSGVIPYGDHICDGSAVYSIDKFRPRFRLRWGNCHLLRNGSTCDLSDEYVAEWCYSTLRSVYPGILVSRPGARRDVPTVWDIPGYLIFLHKFTPFKSPVPYYSLLVEFNPNKVSDDFLFIKSLVSVLKSLLGDFFIWDDTRTDFTFDIPYPISDVRLLSRKSSSSYMGTFYFGKRGDSGYTRVYDKRKELLQHYDIDIGHDVTRVEYESRSGYPVIYDRPYLLGDLGSHEVLRFVPMNDWPAALRTFDPRTAKKIKQESLVNVDFNPDFFQLLYQKLLYKLDLPTPYNVSYRSNGQEIESLELISAELRKFAKNID